MSRIDPENKILKSFHRDRMIGRDIDQLLGICEFALQDGCIDQNEAQSIFDWLKTRHLSLDKWPVSVLYDRLASMLSDGKLDDDEQLELLDLVTQMVRPPSETGFKTSPLPLCDPLPSVQFENRRFCFTGVFDFGRRPDCENAVAIRGGIPSSSVTKKLDYLVIGNVGSEVWRHSSFGTKIAKAVELRDSGVSIAIISESHWSKFIS